MGKRDPRGDAMRTAWAVAILAVLDVFTLCWVLPYLVNQHSTFLMVCAVVFAIALATMNYIVFSKVAK